ncbi:MAG: HAMP domain-containing histidine kinase [Anaerolineales bacterium]|nr:HAMP domain-containing histidine kinase [Anaerolineales bacterium]
MRSLRTRLLLTFAGLILAGFTTLAVLAGGQISSGTVEDFNTQLKEQAGIIARALKEPVEHTYEGETSQTALLIALQAYAGQDNVQVGLYDRNGRFWLDSSGNTSGATDTAELNAALAGQIITDTRQDENGRTVVYAAAPITEDSDLLGIVQLAAPLAAAQSLVSRRWLTLAGGVLGITAVAVIVGLWLAATLVRPLEELQQAANQVAQGNFSQRLPETRQDEIGQLSRTFNHMAAQVETMIAEQRAFAGNASHELRTPLTTIRLRSEALRHNLVNADTARDYIVEIDDEVQRLGNLVQDLIMLSRLDSGRLEAGQEQIEPVRLAQQIMQQLSAQANAAHITMTLDAPPELPTIAAGLSHLHIVFRNLLSNALKYTPNGGTVHWRIAVEDSALHHTIRDNGHGIAPEDLPHLFDRFYRADKSRSRAVTGVGLGLSLVQMIVEFYGGQIWIESEGVGMGTAVHVRWPLPKARRT